ncbi:polysaccharide deacetylase family protein [Solitalea canadensis]|uniref:Putative xylanase/chitin deacetylase n=1 Tax=Solitalea canadensis (strain ATCC 29591 / DSM 3403 / JCM 21819 / LMG 8368 / NBRC 15130 / NCIMB 12057 / USAM 9D) TaxID=929556 RepID=H8KST6_SOLCM|nr:polysaccharide deacetylase family protein [Solitalea canadensis]AFD05396.1 putative xylanase/chitin deacetylase [Solitalea canadensis DSM 3403]
MYPVKTPYLIKKLYPSLTWNLNRAEKVLYITFDDGPIPEVTPFVLEVLNKYNAKATFFCIGDNVRKHPEIFEQVKAHGHSIGNHTFNHLNGWHTKTGAYLKNIEKCNELISTQLFRPPYGKIRPTQILDLKKDYKIIMWDVLSGDFDLKLSPQDCLKNVLQHTESGSIIVFHDSLKAEPRLRHVLPLALEYWSKEGYEFRAL